MFTITINSRKGTRQFPTVQGRGTRLDVATRQVVNAWNETPQGSDALCMNVDNTMDDLVKAANYAQSEWGITMTITVEAT